MRLLGVLLVVVVLLIWFVWPASVMAHVAWRRRRRQ